MTTRPELSGCVFASQAFFTWRQRLNAILELVNSARKNSCFLSQRFYARCTPIFRTPIQFTLNPADESSNPIGANHEVSDLLCHLPGHRCTFNPCGFSG